MAFMKKNFIYWGAGILVLAGVIWLGVNATPNNTPAGPVSFSLDREKVDLGEMAVEDERTAEFILTNNGTTPLLLTQFETSCNCTFAKVFNEEKESPLFNMRAHMPNSDYYWQTDLAPSGQARIQVIYKPSLMPVYGPVERSLRFKTSDSNQPIVELSVKAFVK